MDALAGCLESARSAVVIGPLWLAEALSARMAVLLLMEPEDRRRGRRAVRRARQSGQRLLIALAGVDLPLRPGSVEALLIEGASTLDADALARWMAALVPTLRPGGLLVAADAADNPSVEARLAGVFLGAALTGIVQERPRDGVLLTVGVAPPAEVIAARFPITARAAGPVLAQSIDRG